MTEHLKKIAEQVNVLSENRYGIYVESNTESGLFSSSRFGPLNWITVTPKGLMLVESYTGNVTKFRPLAKGGYTTSRAAKVILAHLDHKVKHEIKLRNEIRYADTIAALREMYPTAKFGASSSTLAPIEMTIVCTAAEAESVISVMTEVGSMRWHEKNPQGSASPSSDPETSPK